MSTSSATRPQPSAAGAVAVLTVRGDITLTLADEITIACQP